MTVDYHKQKRYISISVRILIIDHEIFSCFDELYRDLYIGH